MRIKKTLSKFCIVVAAAAVVVGAFTVYNVQKHKKNSSTVTYAYTDEVRVIEDTENQGVGTIEVSTLKIPSEIPVRRCSYTSSGTIVFSSRTMDGGGIYMMNDDGSDLREIYHGPMDRNYRLMLEDRNEKILLGDHMLEVPNGKTLDTCGEYEAFLVPIEYPAEFVNGRNVVDKWTEVILSNDGEYIVWTTRRSDVGAANIMGHLTRYDDKYIIEDAVYCSNMNAYITDLSTGETSYSPVIGGEVKQFIRGGTAITLVGSAPNGNGNSVIQDLATGKVNMITNNPGYDETTILSPSGKYGIVMTSRFSETTDLAVLGLMDRPYGDVMHTIMDKVYMYSVTGVRNFREGNIGPAIINTERSMAEHDYMGINVSSEDPAWVYYSPMSWNNDSTKATWIEKHRDTGEIRVQLATLKDAAPEYGQETLPTPTVGDYVNRTILPQTGTFTLKGRNSGTVTITKSKTFFNLYSEAEIKYDNYSDDGKIFYHGTEYARGSMMTKTVYTSNVTATGINGEELGMMDVKMTFSAPYGIHTITQQIKAPVLDIKNSHGTARWMTTTADISALVP